MKPIVRFKCSKELQAEKNPRHGRFHQSYEHLRKEFYNKIRNEIVKMGSWLYSNLQNVKCQNWNTIEHKILSENFNLALMK